MNYDLAVQRTNLPPLGTLIDARATLLVPDPALFARARARLSPRKQCAREDPAQHATPSRVEASLRD
jgi:hypothetical protein